MVIGLAVVLLSNWFKHSGSSHMIVFSHGSPTYTEIGIHPGSFVLSRANDTKDRFGVVMGLKKDTDETIYVQVMILKLDGIKTKAPESNLRPGFYLIPPCELVACNNLSDHNTNFDFVGPLFSSKDELRQLRDKWPVYDATDNTDSGTGSSDTGKTAEPAAGP